ncbi:MAG: hypothetical protein JG782_1821 [Anaerophaga sp.]|jgi:hypothetical protein|nr:hypothetical protein [Anaerophaga sp.]MDK2841695.1 hypothetical protein [Anaerophaga sp.]
MHREQSHIGEHGGWGVWYKVNLFQWFPILEVVEE